MTHFRLGPGRVLVRDQGGKLGLEGGALALERLERRTAPLAAAAGDLAAAAAAAAGWSPGGGGADGLCGRWSGAIVVVPIEVGRIGALSGNALNERLGSGRRRRLPRHVTPRNAAARAAAASADAATAARGASGKDGGGEAEGGGSAHLHAATDDARCDARGRLRGSHSRCRRDEDLWLGNGGGGIARAHVQTALEAVDKRLERGHRWQAGVRVSGRAGAARCNCEATAARRGNPGNRARRGQRRAKAPRAVAWRRKVRAAKLRDGRGGPSARPARAERGLGGAFADCACPLFALRAPARCKEVVPRACLHPENVRSAAHELARGHADSTDEGDALGRGGRRLAEAPVSTRSLECAEHWQL